MNILIRNLNFKKPFIQQNMIKSANIYVITTGYLLNTIIFYHWMKNIQHSMLNHPDLNNISIEIYK